MIRILLRLLPLVEKNPILHTSFALGVFDGLCQVPKLHPSSPSVPRELLERLARLVTSSLDISRFHNSSPGYENRRCRCCHLIPQPVHPRSVDVTQLSSFVSGLLSEGIDDRILAVFALKIVRDVGLIKSSAFATFWLPFLRELLGILEKNDNAALSAPRFHHLFAAILETYLNRWVGPPPMRWIPECQYVPCACRLCSLINQFLRSSIRATSISLISSIEIVHLNSWPLLQYANSVQCKFTVEDGVVIIEKLMAIEQGPGFELWRKKRSEANAEIAKFDGGQLRKVLGDSYSSIICYNPVQLTGRSPVAVGDLGKESEGSCPHAAYTGSSSQIRPAIPSPTVTPVAPHRPWLETSVTSQHSASGPGFRLQGFNSPATLGAIKASTVTRRERMSDWDRKHYDAMVAGRRFSLSATTTPASIPCTPPTDRPAASPMPSPGGELSSASPTTSSASQKPGDRQIMSSTWREPKPFPSTPMPQASTAAETSSTRGVLTPVSFGRTNSRRQLGSHTRIKMEAPSQPPLWGLRRKPVEVIDLTGDD